MNSKDLEIARKIAEIEGVELFRALGSIYQELGDGRNREYNPFDWSILGPLMVKYGVLRPANSFVVMHCQHGIARVDMDDSLYELPRAILECIIKSREK